MMNALHRRLDLLLLMGVIMTSRLARAADSENLGFKIQSVECASLKCVFRFVPEEGLHFNLKAPSNVSVGAKILTKSPAAIRIEVPQANAEKGFDVRFFVCDEEETFCKQKDSRIARSGGVWKFGQPVKETEVAANESASKVSLAVNPQGFSDNNLDIALKEARKKNQLVLVDFSAIWCPACLRLEEEVFATAEIKKAAANFVKVRIDADWSGAKVLKERYHVLDMPTLIVLDGDGEERTRFHGFRVKAQMLSELNAVTSKRPLSVESWRKKAVAGNREARDRVGVAAFESLNLTEAVEFLNGTKKENSRLLSAQLELAIDDGERLVALHELLEAFPKAIDAPGWALKKAELSKEPDEVERAANQATSLASERFEEMNKKNAKPSYSLDPSRDEVEVGTYELLAVQAQAAKLLKRLDESQTLWSRAIDDLRGKISSGGQTLILVRYLKRAGREVEIPAVLREAARKNPENYIFDYKLADFSLDHGAIAEAETSARAAIKKSYARNRIEAVALLAKILVASGDTAKVKEARALAKQTLEEARLSGEGHKKTLEILSAFADAK